MKRIPQWEAQRLSIWFEEVSYYEAKKAYDANNNAGNTTSGNTTTETHVWEETEKDYEDVFEEDF